MHDVAGKYLNNLGEKHKHDKVPIFYFYPTDAQSNTPRKMLKFTFTFNVNFNVNFNIFLGIFNCASVG
jgi:hypothetical protein